MTRQLVLSFVPLILCGTAFAQQANVNLDYNPQKNTENPVAGDAHERLTWRRSLYDFAPRLFR